MRRQPCKLFSTTFAKSHLTMLSLNNKPACYLLMVVTSSHQFCRTVLRMRAFDACQVGLRRQPCKLFRTTFAKPPLRGLLFAHVVTSSHQFCRTVLRMQAFDACQQNCATLNSLHVEAASAHEFSAQRIIGEALAGHAQEILQEFQQPFSFIIFRFSLIDLEK